ncbi:hypothetical protein BST61_g11301 [Cercospora zeina]
MSQSQYGFSYTELHTQSDQTRFLLGFIKDYDEPFETQKTYKSEKLLQSIEREWRLFCEQLQLDAIVELQQVRIRVVHAFLVWLLGKRHVEHSSTLQTYWNTLCMVRRRVTGDVHFPLDVKLKMRDVRLSLVAKHSLQTAKKPKSIARVEDAFEMLKAIWGSCDITFPHERQRAQLALIIQLAGLSGNRPDALMKLRYGDIAVSLLRDPTQPAAPPRVLTEFTFKYTKQYQGEKDHNTFCVPDIPREPCLLLCPQTVLLGLLFADHAFHLSMKAKTPEQLFMLRLDPSTNSTSLPIRDDLKNKPLFPKMVAHAEGLAVQLVQ